MTRSPWSASKFHIWAEAVFSKTDNKGVTTTETVDFNISQFASTFEINNIPSATILVTVGRRADNPLDIIAQIHNRINDLQLILPIVVKMEVSSSSGDPGPEIWPDGIFTIFEGYATGAGLRKTSRSMEYTFFLTHWLSDLNFSSAITRTTHPLNPNQVSFAAVMFTPSAGGVGERHMEASTLAAKYITGDVVTKDFWGSKPNIIADSFDTTALFAALDADLNINEAFDLAYTPQHIVSGGGLKQWFIELSDRDQINFLLPNNNFNISDRKNYESLRALSRFEPNIEKEDGYTHGVPLRMKFDSGVDAAGNRDNPKVDDQVSVAADAIAKDIGQTTTQSMASFTVWDKLIQLSSNYCFGVVPLVRRALTVPLTPGLRGKVQRTIWGTQYEQIQMSNVMIRPLRGVVMYRGRAQAMAGSDLEHNQLPPEDATAGIFYEGRKKDGLIMFKEVPRWLSDVVPRSAFGTPTKVPVGTANSPDPGATPDPDIYATKTPAEVMLMMNSMLKRYAQTAYLQEILRGRQGFLSGKLRFDICPGSCVKIEGVEEKGLRGKGTGFEEFQYATVIGVSTAINSETNSAATGYQLMFIRNETENKDDSLTTDANPLWAHPDSKWYGAPMVTEWPFTITDAKLTENNTEA